MKREYIKNTVSWAFRRWLDERGQNDLRRLRDALNSFALSTEDDRPKWLWNKSGTFSVKSVHSHHMFDSDTSLPFRKIWTAKVPLKIKILMRLVHQNAILTKDNLLTRKWQQGPAKCCFCAADETLDRSLVFWVLYGKIRVESGGYGSRCQPQALLF